LSDKGVDDSLDNRDKLPKIESKSTKPIQNGSTTVVGVSCACGHLD